MVIDDGLADVHRAHERAEVAQLAPRARIDYDNRINISELVARSVKSFDRRTRLIREFVSRPEIAGNGDAGGFA